MSESFEPKESGTSEVLQEWVKKFILDNNREKGLSVEDYGIELDDALFEVKFELSQTVGKVLEGDIAEDQISQEALQKLQERVNELKKLLP